MRSSLRSKGRGRCLERRSRLLRRSREASSPIPVLSSRRNCKSISSAYSGEKSLSLGRAACMLSYSLLVAVWSVPSRFPLDFSPVAYRRPRQVRSAVPRSLSTSLCLPITPAAKFFVGQASLTKWRDPLVTMEIIPVWKRRFVL